MRNVRLNRLAINVHLGRAVHSKFLAVLVSNRAEDLAVGHYVGLSFDFGQISGLA